MTYTQEQVAEIMGRETTYEGMENPQFLHCRTCLDSFIGSEEHENMSPQEWGRLEASSSPFTYPDGSVENIVSIWCGRCHKRVWDTRHLTHKF